MMPMTAILSIKKTCLSRQYTIAQLWIIKSNALQYLEPLDKKSVTSLFISEFHHSEDVSKDQWT